MCGIVGAIYLNGQLVQADVIERMASALRHRGPDDAGVFVDGAAGLGHRRLKIIDLSPAGHQPMSNEDGTIWLTYNGEIYNFPQLREELIHRGHTFSSQSDTEVIVHAYEEWGERCVERFNGMFAFGIWDKREKKLVLMRDRLGVKPLFYYLDEEKLLFASEIKAIFKHPGVSRELDHSALYDYFSLNYVPSPKTPFARIRVLLPGHWLSVANGQIKIVQYWDLHFSRQDQPQTEEQYAEALLGLLEDAVRQRLISDVPLGGFLSGGIDSSATVYFMKRLGHRPLKTFNVGFREKSHDESPYARSVARHLETEHHEVVCTPADVRDLLETIAWHADNLTADPSLLPTYLLAKLAREQVIVVLSGDGGDELFGGYVTYQADVLARRYRRLPVWLRHYFIRPLVAALPTSNGKLSVDYKLKKFVEGAELPPARAHYSWRTIFSDIEKAHILSADFLATVREGDPALAYCRHFANADAASDMDRIFYADFKLFLADSILAKVDTMTMAHSLEAREPLLDYRLVELSASIPAALKIKRRNTKHIFKKAMAPYLPRRIVFRKKEGLHIPMASWFRHDLRSFLNEVLCAENLRAVGIFNTSTIDELKRRHLAGTENNAFKLWGLMFFVAWHSQVLMGSYPPQDHARSL
jgi:asparagine synthase (glutamine-hydrolysing)